MLTASAAVGPIRLAPPVSRADLSVSLAPPLAASSRARGIWPHGGLELALGSHWGRIGVALGWLWGRNRLPTNTLWGGFDVALGGLRGLPPLFLLSAFGSLLSLRGGFVGLFEVRSSRFK